MVLEQIYSTIKNDSTVDALISGRVYPMRMDQEAALPAAVFQLITTVPVTSLDGDSGLDSLRVQVKAWAARYADAHALSDAIRNALRADASLILTTELIEDDQDEETRNYCVIMQFSVWSTLEDVVSPISEFTTHEFEGDGSTTDFLFPEGFRSGSLLLFKNKQPITTGFSILSGNAGVSFDVAPAGGSYKDYYIAFYAKA